MNDEGRKYFEINELTGEIFTKAVFDREKQSAYALAIEARDNAPSARPHSNGESNKGKLSLQCTAIQTPNFIVIANYKLPQL